MAKRKRKKCNTARTEVCDLLSRFMVEHRTTGFSFAEIINIETGKFSRMLGPIYFPTHAIRKDSPDTKNGVIINYCPWCGADWGAKVREDEAAALAKEKV